MINYYIIIIWLTWLAHAQRNRAPYVRTLALATYFKSVEHIILEFGTCINYRNLMDIYKEY